MDKQDPYLDLETLQIAACLRDTETLFVRRAIYERALHTVVSGSLSIPDKLLTLRPEYKRLEPLDAFLTLAQVWRRSPYATAQACKIAGVPFRPGLPPLTANALGIARARERQIPDDQITENKFIAAERVILNAAVSLGLAKQDNAKTNRRPYHGTESLHRLIMLSYTGYAEIADDLLQGNAVSETAWNARVQS